MHNEVLEIYQVLNFEMLLWKEKRESILFNVIFQFSREKQFIILMVRFKEQELLF
jgi:hypothetical protein